MMSLLFSHYALQYTVYLLHNHKLKKWIGEGDLGSVGVFLGTMNCKFLLATGAFGNHYRSVASIHILLSNKDVLLLCFSKDTGQ